jgi:hypothetical protein
MPVAAQKQQRQQMTRISLPCIAWGVQAHQLSDDILQQAVEAKLEASRSADAEAEQPAPAKKQEFAGPLDWEDWLG